MSGRQENSLGISRDARRWIVTLTLCVAAAAQLSRIMQVQSATGEVPFLSANDRSRWCTIAALAVNGRYEIDDILQIRDPQTGRRTWYTIDLVRHRGDDGKQHYYSSKPPLLPTLYAGVYVALRAITGLTLINDPFLVARMMLVAVNLIPLIGFWWLFSRWLESAGLDPWQSTVLVLFIAWGTFLSTFVVTLNNHLPAAIAVAVSLWCIDRIVTRHDARWGWFVLSGLATSFAAACELPALSWVVATAGILGWFKPRAMLSFYAPALLPVLLAFFGTNYLAHGELRPAYAHRSLGEKLAELSLPAGARPLDVDPKLVVEALRRANIQVASESTIRASRQENVFELWDEANQQRFGLTVSSANVLEVCEWGDWYDYPGSYWTSENKQGVDRGEPSRMRYVFHCLIGHHGIFSLTPFWLLSVVGYVALLRATDLRFFFQSHALLIATAILVTSVVAIGFYLARPMEDRNYGGVTSGFRWAFWLAPLWIWLAVFGLKALRSGWARRAAELLLCVSVFSACFPWNNPWTTPWLMQLWL